MIYQHNIARNVSYTIGMKEFAEGNSCYWLLDLIALSSIKPKIAAEQFITWKVSRAKTGGAVVLEANDGGKVEGQEPVVLFKKVVPFSDLPEEATPAQFFMARNETGGWTLMEPSEY